MHLIRVGVLAALIVGSLAARGSDPQPRTAAVAAIDPSPHGTRVFEEYRQTGSMSRDITLPEGTRELAIRLDCAGGKGEVSAGLSVSGGGGAPCEASTPKKVGSVYLLGDGSLAKRKQTITVTAPPGQEWSVAIDAGTKFTSK